jgi:hypothetical protein
MTTFNERPDVRWARLKKKERAENLMPADGATPAQAMLGDLYQLIEALDRRVPRLERVGEAQIARDASDLRERASKLIQQIEDVL